MKTQYFLAAVAMFALISCVSTREKKSAKYYFQHEEKIKEIIRTYDSLHVTQPFNLGFSERDYSKIGIDIITDTIRYALTNQLRSDVIHKAVLAFGYDTLKLRKLYTDLYDIRAIWLGKDAMYDHGEKTDVSYLSFRSVASGSPFLDRKYYTLVFFDEKRLNPEFQATLETIGFKQVKSNVYFTIMGKFR